MAITKSTYECPFCHAQTPQAHYCMTCHRTIHVEDSTARLMREGKGPFIGNRKAHTEDEMREIRKKEQELLKRPE